MVGERSWLRQHLEQCSECFCDTIYFLFDFAIMSLINKNLGEKKKVHILYKDLQGKCELILCLLERIKGPPLFYISSECSWIYILCQLFIYWLPLTYSHFLFWELMYWIHIHKFTFSKILNRNFWKTTVQKKWLMESSCTSNIDKKSIQKIDLNISGL